MRMWGVLTKYLCRKHLLGEHVEMHMFVGTIRKGVSIQGYLDRGLVDPGRIFDRHEELAAEMLRRGMNHQSPLDNLGCRITKPVDQAANIAELSRRCPECRALIEAGS